MDITHILRQRFAILGLLLALLVFACGPEPTPFPVNVPQTPTAAPVMTAAVQWRYALAPNTAGLVPDSPLITRSAEVIQLQNPVEAADLGARYDLVASYGLYPDWTPSPVLPHAALVIAPDGVRDPVLRALIVRSLNPQAAADTFEFPGAIVFPVETLPSASIKQELANLGYPDGIELNVGSSFVPGATALAEQMRAAGIFARLIVVEDTGTALETGLVQAAVIVWAGETERARWAETYGAEHITDLYTTPISYRAVEALTPTFSAHGWPLP